MSKRILIVNVNWVGDVIFSTPFIRAVREANPGAYIACLLHPRCAEMLEDNPHLDEIIFYDEEGGHRGLVGKARLIKALRRRRFNTAFLLHRSFTKALITLMAGIPERIGYPTKSRGRILTKAVEEAGEERHKVEYFLDIARAAGVRPADVSYDFVFGDGERRSVDGLLAKEGIGGKEAIVVLCPGGNWDPKRWPKENFAQLGDLLAEKTGARIVISGAPKDALLADAIRGMMKHRAVVTAGKTTLKQLGALLARAGLVVANDSGPMHIAVAVKAKTIALFGPTSPLLTGPYGKGDYRVIVGKPPAKDPACEIPCYDVTCKKNACMADICVADVLSKAREMLN